MLVIKGPRQYYWLIDNTVDIHVCNDLRLMTNFIEKPTNAGGSIVDGISPGSETVQIKLDLEDGQEEVILNLCNVFYLSNSPSNLVSLSLLYEANIFYDNQHYILYNKTGWKPLTFVQCWEWSFILHSLNLLISATNLLKIGDFYQEFEPKIHLI